MADPTQGVLTLRGKKHSGSLCLGLWGFPRVCSRAAKRRMGELNHHTRRVFYL